MGNITILPRLFFLVFFFFYTCLFLNKACPLWFLLLDILKDVFVGSFPSCDRRISLSQFISGAYKCRRMTSGAKYSGFFMLWFQLESDQNLLKRGLFCYTLSCLYSCSCVRMFISKIYNTGDVICFDY